MRVAATVAALAWGGATPGCARDAPRVVIQTAGGPRAVVVEIADTPARRDRGLMYRRTLPDGTGMLFVFDETADHAFWMKNTVIPLDMLFIGPDGRIVGLHAGARPLSLAPIRAGRPSRFVLEVPAGWAARAGVAVGDRVELPASVEFAPPAY